jgi:hypothetical protein
MTKGWTDRLGKEIMNSPKPGYSHSFELNGWEYVVDRENGSTVLCAYRERTQELRINVRFNNNIEEIADNLAQRPGCLGLGGGRECYETEFEVKVKGRLFKHEGRLVSVRGLQPEQAELVKDEN